MTAAAPAVDVLGSLEVRVPSGRAIQVDGRGAHVVMSLPLAAVGSPGCPDPRRAASVLSALTDRLGLTVDLRFGSLLRVRFAPAAQPGLVSRLLGYAPFRIALFPA